MVFTSTIKQASPPPVERLPSWTFDPEHTEVGFFARRMGATWVDGRFTNVHGKLYLDGDEPATGSCVGEIDVASLRAGEAHLNTQLRAADLLGDGRRAITFTAQLAYGSGDTDLEADVLLTIRGITQRVRMGVAYLGEWRAPMWTGDHDIAIATRMGLRAEGVITPKDFYAADTSARCDGECAPANGLEITLELQAILDADLIALRPGG